jgi:undecaprenyl diphosphate synthase
MWLIANSEFYFSDTFWPAFGKKEFTKALSIYASRRRMLGK